MTRGKEKPGVYYSRSLNIFFVIYLALRHASFLVSSEKFLADAGVPAPRVYTRANRLRLLLTLAAINSRLIYEETYEPQQFSRSEIN